MTSPSKETRISRWIICAMLGAAVTGCAATPTTPEGQLAAAEANDPMEPTNRAIFAFNKDVDDSVGKPVARAYRDVVPEFARDGIRNVLGNIEEPANFVNAVLQGEDERAAETAVRFIFNSTAGIAGIFDVAADYGLEANEEDFGQTLAVWGVDEGPYVVLPLLGPSTARDAVGEIVDNFTNPIGYVMPGAASITASVFEGIDLREQNLDTLDDLERNSIDYYASMRSLYRQNRQAEIDNGETTGPILEIPVYASTE